MRKTLSGLSENVPIEKKILCTFEEAMALTSLGRGALVRLAIYADAIVEITPRIKRVDVDKLKQYLAER